jgi:hypothetical protein
MPALDLARYLPKEVSCMAKLGKRKLRLSGYKSGGQSVPLPGNCAYVLPVWAGWRASVENNNLCAPNPASNFTVLCSAGPSAG